MSKTRSLTSTAERPDITSSRSTFELDDLGSHPVGRAIDVVICRLLILQRIEIERDAEIAELDVARFRA